MCAGLSPDLAVADSVVRRSARGRSTHATCFSLAQVMTQFQMVECCLQTLGHSMQLESFTNRVPRECWLSSAGIAHEKYTACITKDCLLRGTESVSFCFRGCLYMCASISWDRGVSKAVSLRGDSWRGAGKAVAAQDLDNLNSQHISIEPQLSGGRAFAYNSYPSSRL